MASGSDRVIVVYADQFEAISTRGNKAVEIVNRVLGNDGTLSDHAYQKACDEASEPKTTTNTSLVPVIEPSSKRAEHIVESSPLETTCFGCGNAQSTCTRDKPRCVVDGLTVAECLAWFTDVQQSDGRIDLRKPTGQKHHMTAPQFEAAKIAWAAELRRRVDEQRAKERNAVTVQDQWGDDD